jgi:hypothetical protein
MKVGNGKYSINVWLNRSQFEEKLDVVDDSMHDVLFKLLTESIIDSNNDS